MPETTPTPPGCPICGRAVSEKLKPFCSKRCANIDLGRWFTGQYLAPARDSETDDE